MQADGGSHLGSWVKRAGFGASLAGVVLGTLALAGPPAATAAGTTGGAVTVTTTNVALDRGECARIPVVVAAEYDGSGTDTWSGEWSVKLKVTGEPFPRHYRGFDDVKTFKVRKCAGLFRTRDIQVEATWKQFDSLGEPIATGTTKGSFTITRNPRANTRLKVSKDPYGSTGWKVIGTLTGDGQPLRLEKVSFWVKRQPGQYSYWDKLARLTKLTGAKGQCTWRTKRDIPINRFTFQLRYEGDKQARSARSRTFRLQPR